MSAGRCLRRLPKSNSLPKSLPSVCRTSEPIRLSINAALISRRQFTSTPRHRNAAQHDPVVSRNATENEPPTHEKSELALEDELLAIQDAAIADLEAKLGKPLQQAIEEDQLAEALLTGTTYDNVASEDADTLVEETESPFTLLRAAGSPPEDVVREARNIFRENILR